MDECEAMDKLVKNNSFALYQLWSHPTCESYQKCDVVKTHFVVGESFGAGWMFPKRSQFLPILNHYIGMVKEGGSVRRISHQYDENSHLPEQECFEYNGDPIAMKKVGSLFALIVGGMGISLIILV